MQITTRIADFISGTKYSDLPEHTIEKAKLAFLDWLGVTLAGTAHESSVLTFKTLRKFSGRKQATILGFRERTDIFLASFLNGYFSHVLDYDDIHLGMFGHPSVPIFPALQALAEWKKKSGKEFILAYTLGVDLECRLGEAVNPQHYNRGWHSTSTLGHFASAVGAAKLLDLDTEKIVQAIGIAGTLSSGVRQVFGTMCKPLNPGKAASNGLLAAILAENNFTSSKEMIGGENGFTSVFCDKFDLSPMDSQLGQMWKVDEIMFKRYASCYRTHAVIECVLSLRHRLSLDLEKVASIHCKIPPIALDHARVMVPQNGLEAKFSQPFCAAVALVEGKATEQQFADDKVKNPTILALVGKIRVQTENTLGPAEAAVEIYLKDGAVYKERIDVEKGRPSKEKILAELNEKFRALVSQLITSKKCTILLDSIMNLEAIRDVRELVKLCG